MISSHIFVLTSCLMFRQNIRMKQRKLFVIILYFAVGGIIGVGMRNCYIGSNRPRQSEHPLSPSLRQIPHDLPPLNLAGKTAYAPAIQAYFEYYGLNLDGVDHAFGTFSSGGYLLAAHVFKPAQPQGTIFVLHGYLDHAGILKNLIRYCVAQQWAVAVYDLPGHGLSSGTRAAIADFADYAEIFNDFLKRCQPDLPPPYHLISHSTGGAIALEYVLHTPQHPLQRFIFLSPLVRHAHWKISKMAYALGRLIRLPTVPRRYAQNSSDLAFREFIKNDPLQTDRVPLQWTGALYAWNHRFEHCTPLPLNALIIQGQLDDVVDWQYNIPLLRQKLPAAEIVWIEDGGHQLLNENQRIVSDVLTRVNTYLLTD